MKTNIYTLPIRADSDRMAECLRVMQESQLLQMQCACQFWALWFKQIREGL